MEQHPVPQNVTNFQFRLVGDMTIKQFGYLAGGAILAIISFKLPLPIFFTWPLTAGFALFGVGLAFVPVEERPMDVWVMSFLKSVYNPTQFVWKKTLPAPQPPAATTQNIAPAATANKPTSPASPVMPVTPPPIVRHTPSQMDNLKKIFNTGMPTNKPYNPPSVPAYKPRTGFVTENAAPTKNVTNDTLKAEAQVSLLERRLAALEIEMKSKGEAEKQVTELQNKLTALMIDKTRLEQEITNLKRISSMQAPVNPFTRFPGVAPVPRPAPRPAPDKTILAGTTGAPGPKKPTVNIIEPQNAVRAGLPKLTSYPNVVTGILKDNQNNLLPGVLVTVRDKDGTPLRALKTNKLGQFAASTQLPDGVYFVEIEDPRNRYIFDRAQITLNGSIMPPLEIVAKSQKEVSREKLAQEIFGQPKM